jgi:hypothetical protein
LWRKLGIIVGFFLLSLGAIQIGSKMALNSLTSPDRPLKSYKIPKKPLKPQFSPEQINQVKADVSQEIGEASKTDLSGVTVLAQNYCYFKRLGKTDPEIEEIAFETLNRFGGGLTEAQKAFRKRLIVATQVSAKSRLCP